MKYNGLLVIVIVVTIGYTHTPDSFWTKKYGCVTNDAGNSIKQTSSYNVSVVENQADK